MLKQLWQQYRTAVLVLVALVACVLCFRSGYRVGLQAQEEQFEHEKERGVWARVTPMGEGPLFFMGEGPLFFVQNALWDTDRKALYVCVSDFKSRKSWCGWLEKRQPLQ